jgi:hypothetical protein
VVDLDILPDNVKEDTKQMALNAKENIEEHSKQVTDDEDVIYSKGEAM